MAISRSISFNEGISAAPRSKTGTLLKGVVGNPAAGSGYGAPGGPAAKSGYGPGTGSATSPASGYGPGIGHISPATGYGNPAPSGYGPGIGHLGTASGYGTASGAPSMGGGYQAGPWMIGGAAAPVRRPGVGILQSALSALRGR